MNERPRRITLDEWDGRYGALKAGGLCEPAYGGPLRRHVEHGDTRLRRLRIDNSPAALRLWNFLLSEEDRLRQARREGKRLVAAMKDLGTVPVMAYALDDVVTFYADGAWWLPCVMENQTDVLEVADRFGIDESFCPVRAMLGAYVNQAHFPLPDLTTCSVGATCDDVAAIAQRLAALGFDIFWWEMPHRRHPEPDEPAVTLPGGFLAAESQVAFVRGELQRVRGALESLRGQRLDDARLAAGIQRANRVRRLLAELRRLAYSSSPCPLPALEMLVAEMLAIHFCSDQAEAAVVLEALLAEVRRRVGAGEGVLEGPAVRVFWVNPVADLRVMNLLEDAGGRVCGSEYLFCHALDPIPEDLPPMEALARAALADPMVGSPADRAARICADVRRFAAEAVVISRIPGASHCGLEGGLIGPIVRRQCGVPVMEIEVPPITDALEPTLRTRLEALVETVKEPSRR
jgi:benzoyl-CoA reductase/2-hydroxyglutaryl-CoA dehydratase subunit BcrC/BadD/HgdB